MQKILKEKNVKFKDPNALTIWNEVVNSLDEYADDSVLSKFFYPEPLTLQCRLIAAGITASLYNPVLSEEEAFNIKLYHIILIAAIWGLHIFLKEWCIVKNNHDYKIRFTKDEEFKKARNKILKKLSGEVSIPKTPQRVIDAFLNKFISSTHASDFNLKNKVFLKDKFESMLIIALYFGYLFGKESVL